MKLVDAVSLRSRRRKLRLFLDELRPTAATTVLDVGADEVGFGSEGGHSGCGTHNFFEELYPWPSRITALGLHDGTGFRSRYPEIAYVEGDACALPFPDQSFDVVFSNAVIEHVGDVERQGLFVAEALRVGRRVFVTTPNRWFPVELHTHLPLVHWLPESAAHRVYDLVRKPWAKENHLLGPGELERLFHGRARIVNLGMTLVAIVD
jgi:SAM-dependent methyltransferase